MKCHNAHCDCKVQASVVYDVPETPFIASVRLCAKCAKGLSETIGVSHIVSFFA